MANDISNLPNSFIQWCDSERPSSCSDYNGVMLPMHNAGDVQWMVRVNDTSDVYLNTLTCYIIKGDYAAGQTLSASDIITEQGPARCVITGSDWLLFYNDPVCEGGELNGYLYPPDPQECVFLALTVSATKEIVCISQQRFYYEPDTCWTHIIRYRCSENSYGFFYEEADAELADFAYYNQIRLPLTLMAPTPVTKKTGFRKSDGSYVTLSASKSKQWTIDAGYMDDHLHQCLDAAIDSDEVFIASDVISGCDYSDYQMYHPEDDNYTIDWQDRPGQHLGVAKASFKMLTTPYYSDNNNC